MKTGKLLFFLAFLASPLYAAATKEFPSPPYTFGGGVDYKNVPSQIRDDRAADQSNLVSYTYGTVEKRLGSRRFIDQAKSTDSFNSLYRAYTSSGGVQYRNLIATTRDGIFKATTTLAPQLIELVSTLTTRNQHFSFAMIAGQVVMTGDALTDSPLKFNIVNSSMQVLMGYDASTASINLQGKYVLASKNYLLMANVRDVSLLPATTYFPNRVYYSLLVQPPYNTQMSSFTIQRYIEARTDGLEEITALWEQNGKVEIGFPSNIYELSFNVLNLTAFGGDFTVTPIVNGFGVLAPRTLQTDGIYSYFLSAQGIVRWDGGRKTRLEVEAEKSIISGPVEPIIRKIIQRGTYQNANAHIYKKRNWYVLNYEDPDKLPRGKPNSTLIYDMISGEWYPQNGWTAECMESWDGAGDSGELVYGDAFDGYTYYADDLVSQNDARREMSIDGMGSANTSHGSWNRRVSEYYAVKEGTEASKLTITGAGASSMSIVGIYNFGEWQDKSKVTVKDKLSFKVFTSSHIGNIQDIRVDLEVGDGSGTDFDTAFTSVTISSTALTAGGTSWTTIEFALSSFTILNEWTNLAIEQHPFADSLTFYGLRFVMDTIGPSEIVLDDVRLVGSSERPLNAFRLSKQYNLGSNTDKTFREIILDAESSDNTNFYIDISRNFGQTANTIPILGKFGKKLWVTGTGGQERIVSLDPITFEVTSVTAAAANNVFAFRSITNDGKYIHAFDRYNNRLVKIDPSSPTVFVSTLGTTGSGNKQFDNGWQIALAPKDRILVADMANHRVKVHSSKDYSFLFSFGSLGRGTTNFHLPTGVAADERYAYVCDDGNRRVMKFVLGTTSASFVTSALFNSNTFGSCYLAADENSIYAFYNKVNSTSSNFTELVAEKRLKNDLSFVNSSIISAKNSVLISTPQVMGEPTLQGDFIYFPFTDDANGNGSYYLQKRLKDGFSLVKESKFTTPVYGLSGSGLSFNPRRQVYQQAMGIEDANYIQLRFRENDLDNPLRLLSNSFGIIDKPYQEK